MLLEDPKARTARLLILDVHNGVAALDSSGEWAFTPTAPVATGRRAPRGQSREVAWIDGEEVVIHLDRSRYASNHPFFYAQPLSSTAALLN